MHVCLSKIEKVHHGREIHRPDASPVDQGVGMFVLPQDVLEEWTGSNKDQLVFKSRFDILFEVVPLQAKHLMSSRHPFVLNDEF